MQEGARSGPPARQARPSDSTRSKKPIIAVVSVAPIGVVASLVRRTVWSRRGQDVNAPTTPGTPADKLTNLYPTHRPTTESDVETPAGVPVAEAREVEEPTEERRETHGDASHRPTTESDAEIARLGLRNEHGRQFPHGTTGRLARIR